MSTTLSGATIVAANSDQKPSGVTPASGSDGTFTWVVVGQKGNTITLSVSGKASAPRASGNTVTAAVTVVASTTNYVQVTAAFTSPQDQNNWTIQAGKTGGSTIKFVKGSGAGKPRKATISKASISRK